MKARAKFYAIGQRYKALGYPLRYVLAIHSDKRVPLPFWVSVSIYDGYHGWRAK